MPPHPDEVWSKLSSMPPVAHELRSVHPDRWIRFHSLPEMKRYPDTDEEWDEVLIRADTLIGAACPSDQTLLIVSANHGRPGLPPDRTQEQIEVQPDADYWREVVADPEGDDWPLHLWTSWTTHSEHSLDPLIRRTAAWELTEVLVVAPRSCIALHPYDGGMDVLLPTPKDRARWSDRFKSWASPLPSGL